MNHQTDSVSTTGTRLEQIVCPSRHEAEGPLTEPGANGLSGKTPHASVGKADAYLTWSQLLGENASDSVPLRLQLDKAPVTSGVNKLKVIVQSTHEQKKTQTALKELATKVRRIFAYSKKVWGSQENWLKMLGEQDCPWPERVLLLTRPITNVGEPRRNFGTHQSKLLQMPDGTVFSLWFLKPRNLRSPPNPLGIVPPVVTLIALAEVAATTDCQAFASTGESNKHLADRLTAWFTTHGGSHLPDVAARNVADFKMSMAKHSRRLRTLLPHLN